MNRVPSLASLGLGLALLLATGPDSLAQAPPPLAVVGDSGVVILGSNQKLRLTVVGKGGAGDATIRFRTTTYADGACDAGVCTHAVVSQTTSAPTVLSQGEGASIEIDSAPFGVRVEVLGSTARVRVLAEVHDGTSNTLQIIAILIG
jgi:hypothetical protein